MKEGRKIYTILSIFLTMILVSICDNVKGVFIPVFKEDFLVNDTSIGLMLTACSLGYILSTYIGGILCEKIGQKKVFILGFIFIEVSLIFLYFASNFYVLLVELFFFNIGISLLAIGINTLIPVLISNYQAVLMNLTHFCYGIGAAIAPRVSGLLLYKGTSWRQIYLYIAIITIVIFLVFLGTRFSKLQKIETQNSTNMSDIFKNKLLYMYICALGFYVFAEIGTANWFVNYTKNIYAFNENKGSFYLALFFIVFALGRLIGGFIVEKFGYLKTTIISLFIAAIMYTTGILLGENGMIIISISGLFFAITFPTIVLTISKFFEESSSYVTGVVITFTFTINMILNMLMGYLNDVIGIYNAYYIIPMSLWISMLFTILIYKNTKVQLYTKR